MMTLKLLLVFICMGVLCSCLESPEPEVLLQPRNFNPHPYQEGVRVLPTASSRLGPVLFPQEQGAGPGRAAGHLLTAALPDVRATGVENHPYANVARKQRIKLAGRFSPNEQGNNINSQVYSGLANYAAKVLKKPSSARHNAGYADVTLAGEKKDYAFSYAVKDHATGDDFSHRQSQDSKATHGEYRVKLPDGRVQIVSYTADKNGYKADVKYDDDLPVERPKEAPQPAKAPQSVRVPDYDYNYDQHLQYAHDNPGNPLTQIELPLYAHNTGQFQIEAVTPKFYQNGQQYVTIYPVLDELQKHSRQYVPHDKVQIYHQGEEKIDAPSQHEAHIQSHPQYEQKLVDIGTATLVPYSDGHILKGYENILVSTVAPEHYPRQVYVTAARHNVPSSQNYYKKR